MAFSYALEKENMKISPLVPTMEAPPGDAKYSTVFGPLTFEIDAGALQ